jgi:hypothetical protein
MYTRERGQAEVQAVRRQIREVEEQLRLAGRVTRLPLFREVEAAVRGIIEAGEPETYAERRPILEALVDLRCTMQDDMFVQITGQIPILSVESTTSNMRGNWDRSLSADANTVAYAIPFILKRKVA